MLYKGVVEMSQKGMWHSNNFNGRSETNQDVTSHTYNTISRLGWEEKGGPQNSPEPLAASQSLLPARLYQLASFHFGHILSLWFVIIMKDTSSLFKGGMSLLRGNIYLTNGNRGHYTTRCLPLT